MMHKSLRSLSKQEQNKLKKREPPQWLGPMLATLTDKRFSDPDWIFERKLDGERCLAYKKKKDIMLYSRNRKQLNVHYPELVQAFQKQEIDECVVDGEIVAFRGNVTDFSRLQERMHVDDPDEARATNVAVFYYIFDILYVDGYLTTNLSLRARKGVLKRVLSFKDPMRYCAHRNEQGKTYYQQACKKGWEGIIAKQADSGYISRRSSKWLKFKCVNQQEFVIGGYTEPQGERLGFGALLIGYYQNGALRYAGKVGTGYDDKTLKRFSRKLDSIERKTSPFSDSVSSKNVHWVTPKFVAQIAFTEWTEGNRLRHPRFKGLRRDKEPGQVRRES